MRLILRCLYLLAAMTMATGAGAHIAEPRHLSAGEILEGLISTPGKARAAAEYWTFDRMDGAIPLLPDVLDPVTLQPIVASRANPARRYR